MNRILKLTTFISFLVVLNTKGWSISYYANDNQKIDSNKNRVYIQFNGINNLMGSKAKFNPVKFNGSIKYVRDFTQLRIKSFQFSPLLGYSYFNYTYSSAFFNSQINGIEYGLNTVFNHKNKPIEFGLQTYLFNEKAHTLSNNQVIRYLQNGYTLNLYASTSINTKSIKLCPIILLGYTNRMKYKYKTDDQNITLNIGLQVIL